MTEPEEAYDNDAATVGIPDTMYLLFENGLFMGAFVNREKAESFQTNREIKGKPRPKLVVYKREKE